MECKINLELFFMQHFCKKLLRVKVGMLQRGEKFSLEERESLVKIQKTLRTIAMTLVSFYQV